MNATTIGVTDGRVLLRAVSSGDVLMGCVHIPTHNLREGASYLAILDNNTFMLVDLQATETLPWSQRVGSVDDHLRSQIWHQTTTPSARVVRVFDQGDGYWMVYGPRQNGHVSQDQWFDIDGTTAIPIAAPEVNLVGDTIQQISQRPLWPRSGVLHTMVPQDQQVRAAYHLKSHVLALSALRSGFNAALSVKSSHLRALDIFAVHPQLQEMGIAVVDKDYITFLAALSTNGLLDKKTPLNDQQYIQRDEAVKKYLQWERPELLPVSTVRANMEPLDAADALLWAVVNGGAVDAVLLEQVPDDYLLLAAPLALNYGCSTVVKYITEHCKSNALTQALENMLDMVCRTAVPSAVSQDLFQEYAECILNALGKVSGPDITKVMDTCLYPASVAVIDQWSENHFMHFAQRSLSQSVEEATAAVGLIKHHPAAQSIWGKMWNFAWKNTHNIVGDQDDMFAFFTVAQLPPPQSIRGGSKEYAQFRAHWDAVAQNAVLSQHVDAPKAKIPKKKI